MKLGQHSSSVMLSGPPDAPSYPSLYLDGKDAAAVGDSPKVGDVITATVQLRVASISKRSGSEQSLSLEVTDLTPAPKPEAGLDRMYPTMTKG